MWNQTRRLANVRTAAVALSLVLSLAPVTAAQADPAPGTGSVAGTLVDAAAPVPDATVELLVSPYGVVVKQGRTDASGAFRLTEVRPAGYALRFRLPGGLLQFHPATPDLASAAQLDVRAGVETTIQEAVVPHGTLGGRITTDTGAPAPGARVELHRLTGGAPLHTVLTDADGSYLVRYPPTGQVRVAVAAAERGATNQWAHRRRSYTEADPVTVTPGQHRTVDERLLPSGVVTGRFTRNGVPVPNVVVYATAQRSTAESVSNWTAADGTFRLRPYPGSYKLLFVVPAGTGLDQWLGGAESEGATQPLLVGADSEVVLHEQQLPTGLVSGRLTEATGAPVVRAAVVIYDPSRGRQFLATTDDDGSWFKIVWPGSYAVRFETADRVQWATGKLSAATADPVTATADGRTVVDDALRTPAPRDGVPGVTDGVPRATGGVPDATGGVLTVPAARVVAADSGQTLRAKFDGRGRQIGVAVDARKLADPVYSGILDREFNSLTPENELEWDSVEPAPGQFVFTRADQLVAHAQANDMRVHGRSLLAPNGIHSAWVGNLTSAATLRPAMNRHITAVMTHFRGQVRSWGVVTEAYADNGALRQSRFLAYLGAGYVEEAFRTARAADPTAELCYSDHNVDSFSQAKTQAVYAMVRDFRARGVPIDCVALNSHFTPNNPVPSDYAHTLARFAALGVRVRIAELDIAGSGAAQAHDYRRVVAACLGVPACSGVTIWGVRDIDSWRPGDTPVLFDAAGEKKPAYHAVLTV
ncbi:endo-1,4-beta-xylanase [Micromonospora sp. WMMD1102]|uniref:endo-1,4-beta-xylanase n=1 Tax=Micromonospora sp. WMMD1102 TaxID=3016105 RepID=UPI002414D18D|nr:endo-1,4-beta-xylanase [Micromonospora sp. WMMD1102]MDG4789326.1 endo-1,4-beta-xylanase [Micromonospora sp. WMMD1102]